MAKPKITREFVEQAARLKRDGLTNKDICQALGICEQTLYRWLAHPSCKLHRELKDELKKAEADYKAVLLASIMDTATRDKNPQWTAAAWLLERKYPDEYAQAARKGEEQAVDAPQIVLGVTVQAARGETDA